MAHFENDTIQPNNTVKGLQRPLLPFQDVFTDLGSDVGDTRFGEVKFVDLPQLLFNIAGAHALGIERDYQFFDTFGQTATFRHYDGLKSGGPVPGYFYPYRPIFTF